MKDLEGNGVILQDLVPDQESLLRVTSDVMRLPAPNLRHASEAKNAFRFTENNSDLGFFLLLKFITHPDGSQISLSAKIPENVLEPPEWSSYMNEK
jgi:hypothetical protein